MTNQRKCASWVESFVQYTSNTESPELCRRWAAIGTIGAVLEQKVYLQTYARMHPNIYAIIVAPPGVGKTQALGFARSLLSELPEPHIAPTSVNVATIVDQMKESKRSLVGPDMRAVEYNALTIIADEFGTFMSKYEDDMIAMLAHFYDVTPYGQRRRGNGGLKIAIEKPLLNMMVGSTPSVLMKFMPEAAWQQGLTSRIILVYDDRKGYVDDFATRAISDPADLIYDLRIINNLVGEFKATNEYAELVNAWRQQGEEFPGLPKPTHPRLEHYNTRRKAHLYRLSMIAAIDRGNILTLDRECFNVAMGWMQEVEANMPQVFRSGSNIDTSAMDEIHYIVMRYNLENKRTMPEHILFREARKKIRPTEMLPTIELMIRSGMLQIKEGEVRQGARQFVAVDPNLSIDAGQAVLQ